MMALSDEDLAKLSALLGVKPPGSRDVAIGPIQWGPYPQKGSQQTRTPTPQENHLWQQFLLRNPQIKNAG